MLVTPRSGCSIMDGDRVLTRGDLVEADSDVVRKNRGSFMTAVAKPSKTLASKPKTKPTEARAVERED